MKKNILYISIAAIIGLFVGYLIFANKTNSIETHNHLEEDSDQKWTCSMHPQIMQSEPGDCPICGMDLIPAEIEDDHIVSDQFKMTKNAITLANIQTMIVGQDEFENDVLTISGKIKENETTSAVQSGYFSGRIERLYINAVGETVNQGQLLGTIYSPELVAAQQELLTAVSLKASQPELYEAVRTKLKLWKLSEKQINQIEVSGKIKENFPIYASVSGIVSKKIVEQGDYVKQGQPLFNVTNLNTVWAVFDIYENQVASIKKGQKINVVIKAYPNKKYESSISFINPVLDVNTRTVEARVELNNKEKLLKPGMFVSGTVINPNSQKNQESIVIPASAVLWTGKRSLVYVKTHANEPIFEMREVVIGDQNEKMYTIYSGLQKGEQIVTQGTFTVDAAAQLQGKKSMMNR
ncbi:efflux RND transporter periplasmic adaptor subunit [Aquimarina mytili]|uniref:Efflux RND transporter periplasmic adaptor subunit n=1 Tax=Aquimarina mytili TaxID=874423 RepID=A0A936ZR23_9FLAO|nr:efflux RND transporter periplasmic adaptor subunit [Aquimarina mytili]MBL0682732.1 efflux RND transporter periplasmic adaptor subunit [Aquimarina mytili]